MKLRTILLVLALLAFLSASVGGYLYYSSLKESAFKEAERQATSHTKTIRNLISSALSENQKAVKALAGLKELQIALLRPNEANLTKANSELDHFQHALEVSVCYLMGKDGNTIASSNQQAPDSFVGKNYGFRPYFQQAIIGTPAVYMALGVTSRKRGVYYSHPVYVEGEASAIGVAVIKASVASMEEKFSQDQGGIGLVTDPHGMIFVSSRADWLYRLLWRSSPETISEIAKTRQFGNGPWEWTGLKMKDENRALDQKGNEYLIYQMSIDNYPSWNVIYLVSLSDINQSFIDPLIKTSGSIILILCILIGSSVFLLYREAHDDIVERKRTEEALRESEEKFRAISGTAADAIILMDNEGRISYWNPAAERTFGYTPGEAIGQELHVFLAPEEFHQPYKQGFKKFRGTGEGPIIGKTAEFVAVRKDGTQFPIEVSTSALNIKGEWHSAGIIRDISERKSAEDEIRKLNEDLEKRVIERSAELFESEQRHRSLLEASADPIVVYDMEGRVTYLNPAFTQTFGWSLDELLEKSIDFVPEKNRQETQEAINRMLAGEKVQLFETKRSTKDGRILDIQLSTSLFQDRDGYPAGNIVILRDVTKGKQAEDALRKAHDELELRVAERTSELVQTNVQLKEEIEERMRAEEELNLQKTYFQHLFENSPEASVILDNEDRVVDVNNEFEKLFHYSIDEIKGKFINDLIVSDDLLDEARTLTQLTFNNQVIKKETVRKRKEGTLVDVSILGYPITFNGKQVGTYAIYQDITERKRAEKALRESETEYRNLVDTALVGVYKTDLEGNIFYVNDALVEMMGFDSPEDMKSTGVLARYKNLQDRDGLIDNLKETGAVRNFEVDLLTKSGDIINVILTAAREEDIISGMIMDITERKRAAEERLRLATAVEQAAESVIISDRRGTIQYVNPAFEKLSGFTQEDIVGKNFRILKSAKHDEAFYNEMWDTISRGGTWTGRINNRMKDGTFCEFETAISPIRESSGAIVNFVSVNRDVTQEVALEAQLLQAQKMEAVGTLAGGIAHDFNNLLQVIQGYSEVLLDGLNQDQSNNEALQKIHRSAKRGAELTRQLLTFSRKVQSKKRPLDLNHEVQQVKNLLERTIPKMIEFELYLAETPSIINADPAQVEQALMNLAVNAMDAMSDGGKIVVETEKVILDDNFCDTHFGVKPGPHILLSISDTGHGMSKETLEHVFEPFYTTKEVGKGTGLGLAMVYGIVKNHEGYVMCYSEPNTGTTFKIYLPAMEQDEDKKEVGETADNVPGGTETILLVDDEEYIRELGVELLSDVGYKVLTATDGESALKLYERELKRIDLVILDLVIPGMGGKKCHEEILKKNPKAKILIVSGYSAEGPGKEALDAGAKGFVGKPFDVVHMLQTVREILDQD
jgi:PAS domain S-box-containing protein